MSKNTLNLQQLNSKMLSMNALRNMTAPGAGWVNAVRLAIGMSMRQLANRLSITRQSVLDIERREKSGSITLKSLKDVANALDMEFVYGFVPKGGTMERLIEKKAREKATEIVMRASNTMKLENQENSRQRIEKAIEERTEELINTMPKILWE